MVCKILSSGPQIGPKWCRTRPNDRYGFRVASKITSIRILLLLQSFSLWEYSLFLSWNFFYKFITPNYSHIKIDPKTSSWCTFGQFKEGVFEKNVLLCTPISAQKRPFLVSWGAVFGQKPGEQSVLRSYNPKFHKGWGLSAKLGKHSAIWGKLGTALQAYALNPCTKFAPNPTSRKVYT